jgi:hypothetical protein
VTGGEGQGDPRFVLAACRLRREDAGARVRGPPGIPPVDDEGVGAPLGELIGDRQPREPAADDDDVEGVSRR